MNRAPFEVPAIRPSFNGAAFFQSGKCPPPLARGQRLCQLQWSRFFSKRKMTCSSTLPALLRPASMEPLFFKAENRCQVGAGSRQRLGFNGAAFFQSGKFRVFAAPVKFPKGFNGAAFFKIGKSASKKAFSSLFQCFNGAAFFESGKFGELVLVRAVVRGFNGAAFFESGKSKAREMSAKAREKASMEPLFFKAENRTLTSPLFSKTCRVSCER